MRVTQAKKRKIHEYLAHTGETVLYNTLKNVYKIKGIRRKIKKLIYSCIVFQTMKNHKAKYGKLSGALATKEPFKHLSADIYGQVNDEEIALRGGGEAKYMWVSTH